MLQNWTVYSIEPFTVKTKIQKEYGKLIAHTFSLLFTYPHSYDGIVRLGHTKSFFICFTYQMKTVSLSLRFFSFTLSLSRTLALCYILFLPLRFYLSFSLALDSWLYRRAFTFIVKWVTRFLFIFKCFLFFLISFLSLTLFLS